MATAFIDKDRECNPDYNSNRRNPQTRRQDRENVFNSDTSAIARCGAHFLIAIAMAFLASGTFAAATTHQKSDPCFFPQDLQHKVAAKYPKAKLVELSGLEEDDKRFFQSDHDNGCPGVVRVDFYGDGKPTWALVLIPKSGAKEPTKLVVAHHDEGKWLITVLDTGGPSPNAPVVWSLPPGEYRDVYGDKTIRATKPVIVFCKYESWAILYAWTGTRVTKIWLSD